jgi:DNA-binding CsgD family transcriptional regulator
VAESPLPVAHGREREIAALEELLSGVEEGGRALVLRGDAGIGKSFLLEMAIGFARRRRMRVLRTAGATSETNLPFAGLHQLLRPVLPDAEQLPSPQRSALLAAFGMTDALAPDLFLIALAVLDLLSYLATRAPLLLVVDDAQWLDHSTCDVLAFVARRLEADAIVLLIANREQARTPLSGVIPELRLERLDDAAAMALLETHSPDLPASLRGRLLTEAAGNPLALVELAETLASAPRVRAALLPEEFPLSARLEHAFTARFFDLPPPTRTLLLVAAVNDGTSVAEALHAASLVTGTDVALDAFTPALVARLIEIDETELRFRHPLVRSAIRQVTSVADRHAAHAALATVLGDAPDRRAWHRAAATVGPDETIASELEAAAIRAQRRGDVGVAVAAFERAAICSADPVRRARYLLSAAELTLEFGRSEAVVRLLDETDALELSPPDRMRLTWIREACRPGASGRRTLLEIAERLHIEADREVALNLLCGPVANVWWAESDWAVRERVVSAIERECVAQDDPRLLMLLALAMPIGRGALVIERLATIPSDACGDAARARLLGMAASQVGEFTLAARFLTAAADGLRARGRLALLAQVLVLRAWSAIHLGNRGVAIADAEEGARLARETAQPVWTSRALAAQALLAGRRGETELAYALAGEAELTASEAGVLPSEVQAARGLTALGEGRYDDGYAHLRRIFDPNDAAYHPMQRCLVVGDFVEAALLSGCRDDATERLRELEAAAHETPSPLFHASLRYARALLGDDDALYETALRADATRWPFLRARLQLAWGARLRRTRRAAAARGPLRDAVEGFDALGAVPWAEHARRELRAAGVTSRRPAPAARDQLTAQELHIALLAAEGLSNREIGRKLFLSPRTVSSHLYRAFPKLEVSSRGQLRGALGEDPRLRGAVI